MKTKFPIKSKLELFVVRKITVTFSKENGQTYRGMLVYYGVDVDVIGERKNF